MVCGVLIMSGIRRAPRPAAKPKPKRFMPIHQQILGKPQVELDNVEDLRYRLEVVHDLDEMDDDTYMACHEALDVREANAKAALLKATGKHIKPVADEPIDPWYGPRVIRLEGKRGLKPWQCRVLIVIAILIFLKISAMRT